MLDRNKEYNYEELKKIFNEAKVEVVKVTTIEMDEFIKKEEKGDNNGLFVLASVMQSIDTINKLKKILFGGEEEKDV